ncbi:MAG: YoaK family protein [Eubacteriales bacterium]|jgi:uncharacterized membrane protein YoaK (UPF0700 family)
MEQLKKTVPPWERLEVGIMLALVGGFLDAYTYLFRGGVFANAQTGNMVLMALDAAEGNWWGVLYYLVPISAFFAGVLVTEICRDWIPAKWTLEWRHVILCLEAALILAVGLLPATVPDAVVNVTISFVCSMQVNCFRKTWGLPFATTMCTGNLRSAAEKSYRAIKLGDREAFADAVRYFLIIGAFCTGAAIGAWLTQWWGGYSVCLCSGMLLAVLVHMVRHGE